MGELGSGSGTGYPAALDTDSSIEIDKPALNKTLARVDVPNDIASAIVAIETELGTDPAGTLTDVKTFLQTEHNTDGTHKATAFSVHKNGSDQSISASTLTKVTWSTEDYDKNSDFASDKFTPSLAGKYVFIANIWFKLTLESDKDYEVHIYKNGTSYKMCTYNFDSVNDLQFAAKIMTLAQANGTTDYFEVYVKHTNSVSKNIDGTATKTWFQGYKIR